MKKRIAAELDKIERENNVSIIYACESGSRAWGFPSRDSDYDVRFIYVNNPDWYISIEEKRDVIELPIEDALDLNGWDIRKALKLLRKSNSPLLEWLSSPIVYKSFAKASKPLFALAEKAFLAETSCHHYVSLARNNIEKISYESKAKIKTYLYALRSLLCCQWITKYKSQPPMLIDDLLEEILPTGSLRKVVEEILCIKKQGNEPDTIERVKILDNYLMDYMKAIKENIPKNSHKIGIEVFNSTLRKIVSNSF